MTITLGTGIGVGAITNDRLCRAGRGLHPEVSHVSINCMDETAPCGCGNLGCVEAYLSGKNFCKRTSVKLGEDYISGPNILLVWFLVLGEIKPSKKVRFVLPVRVWSNSMANLSSPVVFNVLQVL